MRNSRKHCGIIIPVYNSPDFLNEVLTEIQLVQKNCPNWQLNVLMIDDGSTLPLPEMKLKNIPITQIRHPQNSGKGTALKTGFAHWLKQSQISGVITLDADMQHPPKFIPQFLEQFDKGNCDIVLGSRKRDPKVMPIHRILSNWLTSLIISMLIQQKVQDSQCGYRLYSRNVLKTIQLTENRFHLESEFLIRSGWRNYKIAHVQIPTIYNDAPSAIRNLPDTLNFVTLIFKLIFERIRGNV